MMNILFETALVLFRLMIRSGRHFPLKESSSSSILFWALFEFLKCVLGQGPFDIYFLYLFAFFFIASFFQHFFFYWDLCKISGFACYFPLLRIFSFICIGNVSHLKLLFCLTFSLLVLYLIYKLYQQ